MPECFTLDIRHITRLWPPKSSGRSIPPGGRLARLFLDLSAVHHYFHCGSVLIPVTTSGCTIHALRVCAVLLDQRSRLFARRPGIIPVLTGVHSKDWFHMRAWPRYLAGFAGKSAALMLGFEASSSLKRWARHRCLFKRKESGWTFISMLCCSPGERRSPSRLEAQCSRICSRRINPHQLQLCVRLTDACPYSSTTLLFKALLGSSEYNQRLVERALPGRCACALPRFCEPLGGKPRPGGVVVPFDMPGGEGGGNPVISGP